MKIKLYTQWKDGVVVCTCPIINKCNKNHGCEELDFILDNSVSISDCMKHDSYTRHKGAIQQRR